MEYAESTDLLPFLQKLSKRWNSFRQPRHSTRPIDCPILTKLYRNSNTLTYWLNEEYLTNFSMHTIGADRHVLSSRFHEKSKSLKKMLFLPFYLVYFWNWTASLCPADIYEMYKYLAKMPDIKQKSKKYKKNVIRKKRKKKR